MVCVCVFKDDEEGEHNFHYEEVKDPFMKEYLRNPREGSTFSSPPFVPRRRIADCWVKEQNFDRTATHYRNTFTNEIQDKIEPVLVLLPNDAEE
eukprot:m.148866 g.148866  ORF g.148866 m.148866 type:complete len:94 (+) comp13266_c3_seq3:96-377(+)